MTLAEKIFTHIENLPETYQAEVLDFVELLETRSKELEDREAKEPTAGNVSRSQLTARDLLSSGLVGMWQDRAEAEDSAAFARQLREKAQHR